ncbi:MAG: carboxypeptidase regulatory-like domain-containing protein, partial [Terriglobales bacterium]
MKFETMPRWFILFFLAVAAVAAPLHGVVRGAGIPLPGATITATQGTATQTAISGDDGGFSFADLAPGLWTLTVTMTGFTPFSQHVTIPADAPVTVALNIAPYQGPALQSAPPPLAKPALQSRPAPAKSGAAAPALDTPPPDALAVNGSVDNGASSQFGLSPAFGNARPRVGALFNGGFGLIFGTSALDARSFSLTGQDTPKPSYNNLTGVFQFGGPLLIPHLTHPGNAPFFFVGYQKSTRLNSVNTSALVPTRAERSGDLSALGGPVLAPGAISAQAAALLALYPMPNFSGGQYNYQTALVSNDHQDRLQGRLSKSFGFRNQLSGLLSLTSTRGDSTSLFGFLDGHSSLGLDSTLSWRHSFSQGIYATFGLDFSRLASRATPFFANRTNVAGAAGILGGDTTPSTWGPPALGFADGFAALNDALPSHNRNQTVAFSVSTYWNHADHNVTFGGDLRRLQFNYLAQQNPRGGFTFNGAATGNAFQDFLQGLPDAADLAFGNADKYFRENSDDLFFVDDWRVGDSITLNLGARWEYGSPVLERYGRLVNLGVAPGFTSAAPVLGSPSNS